MMWLCGLVLCAAAGCWIKYAPAIYSAATIERTAISLGAASAAGLPATHAASGPTPADLALYVELHQTRETPGALGVEIVHACR